MGENCDIMASDYLSWKSQIFVGLLSAKFVWEFWTLTSLLAYNGVVQEISAWILM